MATRATIKNNFLTGKTPIQSQFHEWIDSFFHLTEDSLSIQKITGLQQVLDQLSGGGNESIEVENINTSVFYLVSVLNGQTESKTTIYTATINTIIVFPQMVGHKIQSTTISLAAGKSIKVLRIYIDGMYYWLHSAAMTQYSGGSRYYNGWQHDLPEPDWDKIKATIPASGQLTRDIDGNYYCSGGYSSNNYSKYGSNLNLLKTISDSGTKYNRNMPHIIVDFLGTGKEVLVMPNYNQTMYPSFINLEDFSINLSLRGGFPTGKFVNDSGQSSPAIDGKWLANYDAGTAAFDLKGESLWLLVASYLTNGATNKLISGKFIQDWRVQGSNTIACNFICAGGNFLCTIDGTKFSVFNLKLLVENDYNFDQAYLYSFNHGLAMNNTGYDAYYVYNDKLVMVTFSGAICAFDLNNNGNRIASLSNAGSNQAAFFWRNKVYRTGTKVVTTLPI